MSSNICGASIMLGIGTLAGVALYFHGLSLYRTYKLIQYTPTSKAASVAPGITEVQGKARVHGELKTAPYSRKSCVFYQTAIYRWSGSGKSRNRSLVKSIYSQEPFAIADETGMIAIWPPVDSQTLKVWKGQDYLKCDIKVSEVPSTFSLFGTIGGALEALSGRKTAKPAEPIADTPKGRMRAMLLEECPSLVDYGDRVDVEETYIEVDDPVYVLGTAWAGNVAQEETISIGYDKDNKIFCISDGSEKDALGKISWRAYAFSLIGPVIFAVCAILFLFVILNGLAGSLIEIVIGITAFMYAGFFFINLSELYNGTIRLRQNIERANANVDALYVMRHELIPQLQEVVQGYIEHEKTVQELLAKIRVAAEDQNPASLAMVAENYPELKANENFLLLQKQLETIAEKLAGSQSYVVDATTFYNARVQSFPYFLFTPLVGLHSMPMPRFSATSA